MKRNNNEEKLQEFVEANSSLFIKVKTSSSRPSFRDKEPTFVAVTSLSKAYQLDKETEDSFLPLASEFVEWLVGNSETVAAAVVEPVAVVAVIVVVSVVEQTFVVGVGKSYPEVASSGRFRSSSWRSSSPNA
ncbi:hypothetical protein WICPIJ_005230 [Wickerhamomyces pijperi]|uniref:Uncharacterized protein n=1 Tax=Wickerhamomyces pijperi TaxID=599730 RepID=A0A9P8Q6D2_WICPI|nr:hypothetical protein WICPIJ_005230 [Wickerhamomyces pijperi]